VWYGRGSRYDLVMGHVIVDCRPRGGDTAISYSEMAGYTHLSPQDYALADVYTSRDPNLGNDDGALPDGDVMADLYQIIDLDPLLNPSATNGGTVNGGIGPDLHVVVDLDDPYLRDLEVILRRMGKTESIGANDDTGMDDHPPANAAARIHNHAGVEDRIFPNFYLAADDNPRLYDDSPGNHASWPNVGARINGSFW